MAINITDDILSSQCHKGVNCVKLLYLWFISFCHLKFKHTNLNMKNMRKSDKVEPLKHDTLSRWPAYIACVNRAGTNPGSPEESSVGDSRVTKREQECGACREDVRRPYTFLCHPHGPTAIHHRLMSILNWCLQWTYKKVFSGWYGQLCFTISRLM